MTGKSTIQLLVVGTCYHNQDEIDSFLKRLHQLAEDAPEVQIGVALCDNSGEFSDHSLHVFEHKCIVNPGENLGYFNGCAAARKSFLKQNPDWNPEWTLVCNTDIDPEDQFLSILSDIPVSETIGGLAPHIYLTNDTPQNPYLLRRQPAWRIWINNYFFRNHAYFRYRLRKFERNQLASGSSRKSIIRRPIYAPHGACIILHRNFFENGGQLEAPVFMYHEEIHIAEQMRQLGLKIWYEPELRIFHQANQSTSKVALLQKLTWKRESNRFIWQTYYKNRPIVE